MTGSSLRRGLIPDQQLNDENSTDAMRSTAAIDLSDRSGQPPDAALSIPFDTSIALTSICGRVFLLSVFCCTISTFCFGQKQDALCSGGFGKFTSKFATGVTVSVEAKKSGELATRACEARLIWNKGELVTVPDAWQVDIDVMGADLGLGVPVVSFQTKKSDIDQHATYQVYSLKSPPRLLRTITGGDSFRAVDTNMDSRIEIWTNDASGVDGFENLPLADFDFAPSVVMRFKGQRLIDVSSEFRSYFDSQIAGVRAHIDSQELQNFRNSDGKLSATSSLSGEDLHRLFRTKIKVLEIVWSYLYSGREQDAERALADMWPPTDLERIRVAIQAARACGIESQVDEVSAPASDLHWKKHATVYDIGPGDRMDLVPAPTPTSVDSKPQPIYLHIPLPTETQQESLYSGVSLELVIDAAGKVHSAKSVSQAGKDPLVDALISASADWMFIPAIKGGHAVASRVHQKVLSPR